MLKESYAELMSPDHAMIRFTLASSAAGKSRALENRVFERRMLTSLTTADLAGDALAVGKQSCC